MADYSLEIYRHNLVADSFTLIDVITEPRSLRYSTVLNGIGEASFTVDMRDAKATSANVRMMRNVYVIKRNSTIVFSGVCIGYDFGASGVESYLNLRLRSYAEKLNYRYVTRSDSATDGSDIAWNVINDAQSLRYEPGDTAGAALDTAGYGSLKIAQGNLEASQNRDRVYTDKNAFEAVEQLANVVDSFDFQFVETTNSAGQLTGYLFNTYYPQLGSTRDDLQPLYITPNSQNFTGSSDGIPFTHYTAIGGGNDSANREIEYDQTAIEQNGLQEELLNDFDVKEAATLEEKAAEQLGENKDPKFKFQVDLRPDVSPKLTEVNIGDTLNYNFEFGNFLDQSGTARVIEKQVDVGKNGEEIFSPKLEVTQS